MMAKQGITARMWLVLTWRFAEILSGWRAGMAKKEEAVVAMSCVSNFQLKLWIVDGGGS